MIINRDRFPEVEFLPDDQIREVGSVGEDTLVVVGFEQGAGEDGADLPLVARAYTDNPASEELFAIPIYELLSHSLERIEIPDPITRNG